MTDGLILVNDNIQFYNVRRGIARYFDHVLDGIINAFGDRVVVISPVKRDYRDAKHIYTRQFRGSRYFQDLFSAVASTMTNVSIVFSPFYGKVQAKATNIFTVYDMIVERFPQYFPINEKVNRSVISEKYKCLKKANALIAISKNTARDIVELYPEIDPKKIFVTYLGVDNLFLTDDIKSIEYDSKPYFLYVGSRGKYKNFLRMLSSFGISGLARDFDLHVVSPFDGDFSLTEVDIIAKYKLKESVHIETAVSESELRKKYRNSVALVYPSEYEGFGLPILEAMASGTIVATSDSSSMPEVGGEVALYFDPYDQNSIAGCLLKIANLPHKRRSELISLGKERAKEFSWSKCQNQTIGVFKKFLN